MSPPDDKLLQRNLSGLAAGQDQLATEVQAIRGAIKSVQILLLYTIALAVILYMLIRKGGLTHAAA